MKKSLKLLEEVIIQFDNKFESATEIFSTPCPPWSPTGPQSVEHEEWVERRPANCCIHPFGSFETSSWSVTLLKPLENVKAYGIINGSTVQEHFRRGFFCHNNSTQLQSFSSSSIPKIMTQITMECYGSFIGSINIGDIFMCPFPDSYNFSCIQITGMDRKQYETMDIIYGNIFWYQINDTEQTKRYV